MTTRTLSINLFNPDGSPAAGVTVTIRQVDFAGRVSSDHIPDGPTIMASPLTVTTDSAGQAQVQLIPSGAKLFGTGYEATATIESGKAVIRPPARFLMPDEDTSLHLAMGAGA